MTDDRIGNLYKIKEAADSWVSYCVSEHTDPHGVFTLKEIRGNSLFVFEEMRGSFSSHRFKLVGNKNPQVKEM